MSIKHVMQNRVLDWWYDGSEGNYKDPFNEVDFKAAITGPDGRERMIPGFWGGGNRWHIRYSSPVTGIHKYRTICSDAGNSGLHGHEGEIMVVPYEGGNRLYMHGALKTCKESGKYLMHEDGTPFFWLGDTWWMGLTTRLKWPEGFELLTKDRAEKGFSVVQIVAGLYPDMDPFDIRGVNEAGFPWDTDFKSINPAYFDMADLKISWLVEMGIVPCVVGCWGFFIDFAGKEVIRKHWDYLLARYGAYPVVWCMAGEALMPFYNNKEAKSSKEKSLEYSEKVKKEWTEVTRHLRDKDPFERIITVHPTNYGHNMLEDESLMDLDMLQTGHGGFNSLSNTTKMVLESVAREPGHPVINSEVCYEGICGTSYQEIQRFLFWSCILSGACGHTYGANGIWQLNTREKPYGPSPHGATWGNTTWEEAYQLPGSRQVGLGKKLLERYRWWKFRPHPEWLEKHSSEENKYIGTYAAGIPGEVRVIFMPILGGWGWGEMLVKNIEKDISYRAFYFDPITGDEYDQGEVSVDKDGNWRSGKVTIFQDWVLVLEKIR